MSRLLLLLAIAVLVYLLVRAFRKNSSQKNSSQKNSSAENPGQDQVSAEDMVRCAQCGLHLPKGESVQAQGHFFCSVEHRDAYHK